MAKSKSNLAISEASEDSSPVGSLAKGLKLLDLLVEAPTPMGVSELAAAAGVDTSSVHRLLQVLIDRGDVVRDPLGRRYMAGPRTFAPLGMSHPIKELGREAMPVMSAARNQTGQSVGLVIFIGTQRLTAEVVRGAHPLIPFYDTWLRSPLHGSASGKVLLASWSSEERAAALGAGPYFAATPKTITDAQELEGHLRQLEERGFAIARDDAYVGMTALAAPITYAQRVVGCLALAGRTDEMPESGDAKLGASLVEAATLLSHSAPALRAIHYMFSSRGPVAV